MEDLFLFAALVLRRLRGCLRLSLWAWAARIGAIKDASEFSLDCFRAREKLRSAMPTVDELIRQHVHPSDVREPQRKSDPWQKVKLIKDAESMTRSCGKYMNPVAIPALRRKQ